MRKTARDLWDIFVDLFSDSIQNPKQHHHHHHQQHNQRMNLNAQDASSSLYDVSNSSSNIFGSQHSTLVSPNIQISYINRKFLRTFLRLIKGKLVKNILISLFSTLFNIADSTANNEIYSEYRHLWPSSLANAGSLSLNSINDLLLSLIHDSLLNVNQIGIQWLRTMTDICMTKANYCDAFRFCIETAVYETKYFLKNRYQNNLSQIKQQTTGSDDKYIDEKTIKSMIKASSLLNKHTHAAILCQFLTKNNDYSSAFRYLQEGAVITLTSDEMDLLYKCVWDMTLLEYLTNLNSIRGFISKRDKCLRLCTNPSINESNPNEIFQKTIDSKKKLFFKQLIDYYFLY
jgi:integrator complex subunit 8